MKKVISLIGARPQFIKEAMISNEVKNNEAWQHIVINSGQHYDYNMADVFFQELDIPTPRYTLGIGSGSHGVMTAGILSAVEEILIREKPDALLVYGDTNTTLAGALAAAKLHIPIIHVEAGIRMQPRTMPEEINRVLTDRIASVMCCCSELGRANLAHDGLKHGVHVTGDVMYDLFCHMQNRYCFEDIHRKHLVNKDEFILTTLHRDYNVDSEQSLRAIVEGLVAIQNKLNLRVVWPMHPRAKKMLDTFGLSTLAQQLYIIEPVGYADIMSLIRGCAFVITDSGGLQKEAYFAKKRSIVVMPDTGWRELIDIGWNVLSSPTCEELFQHAQHINNKSEYHANIYGDGNAAKKIIQTILHFLNENTIR